MRVLLLHGLEGSPNGAKAQALRKSFELDAPALPTGDFEACVALAQGRLKSQTPDVVVGSSFGGAVALSLILGGHWCGPTLLLAPASKFLGRSVDLPVEARVLVVHGVQDEVVPVEESRQLVAGRPSAKLVEIQDEHRLSRLLEGERLADYVRQAAGLK